MKTNCKGRESYSALQESAQVQTLPSALNHARLEILDVSSSRGRESTWSHLKKCNLGNTVARYLKENTTVETKWT